MASVPGPDAGHPAPHLPPPRHRPGAPLGGAGGGPPRLPGGHPPVRRLGAHRLSRGARPRVAHRPEGVRPGHPPLGGDPPHLRGLLPPHLPLHHRHRPAAVSRGGAHLVQRLRLRPVTHARARAGDRPADGGLAQLARGPGGPVLALARGRGRRGGLHRPAELEPVDGPRAAPSRRRRPLLGSRHRQRHQACGVHPGVDHRGVQGCLHPLPDADGRGLHLDRRRGDSRLLPLAGPAGWAADASALVRRIDRSLAGGCGPGHHLRSDRVLSLPGWCSSG